jgi:hypothetical protein
MFITAVNNLKLKAKTITNIASEQTITKGTNITQSVGSASNLQGGNVSIKLLTIVPLLLMVMFCALKNAWGVLLKSSSVFG